MIKTIITAVITYLATSIDEIPVLFMLYMDTHNKGKAKTITFAYYIGTFLLAAVGLLGAYGLILLPAKWAVGLIGLFPIVIGIKTWVSGDDDEDEAIEKAEKYNTLWLKVLVITFALGADDLGVYIPLFTTMNSRELLQILMVFAVSTAILCFVSYRLTGIDKLTTFLEKRERIIVSVIFIAIGIYVMAECRTFTALLKLFP